MASVLSRMRFLLWCGFALCVVGAFSVHRYRGRGERRVQHNISISLVQTKYLQLRDSVGDAVSNSIPAYPSATKALKQLFFRLPTATASFPINERYVSRPSLESKIQKVYNYSRQSDSFYVIVGPKGTGKSSLVAHVLQHKSGVLYFKVNEVDTATTLLCRILASSGVVVTDNDVDLLPLSTLYPVLSQASNEAGGRRMTIVFEVEWGIPSSEGVWRVIAAAKKLAVVANVIVILSDASAGLVYDDLRQKFIWVDGMTNEEATTYAKKLYPAIDDGDLELFFDKVGTYPLDVRHFAEALESGGTAADYIESILLAAETDLAGFTHQPILKALKTSPDGVCTVKFKGVKHQGAYLAEPKDVVEAMKEHAAIVYHLPSREYRMASRAHRTALLERYDPKEERTDL